MARLPRNQGAAEVGLNVEGDIPIPAVADAATAMLKSVFGPQLIGAYLHGSALTGALQPQSDVDLIAVIEPPMSEAMRTRLASWLLRSSGRHPRAQGGPRPIELIVFLRGQLAAPEFPACCEFIYGEWLRETFEAGRGAAPQCDAEFTLLLAQAGTGVLPLFGPAFDTLLGPALAGQLRPAMKQALPALLANLCGDERNVLLTLARMWRTAAVGDFVQKDAAARWAAGQMPDDMGEVLALAGNAYLGLAADDWTGRQAAVTRTADHLAERIRSQLNA